MIARYDEGRLAYRAGEPYRLARGDDWCRGWLYEQLLDGGRGY